jgi:hypothetical protein
MALRLGVVAAVLAAGLAALLVARLALEDRGRPAVRLEEDAPRMAPPPAFDVPAEVLASDEVPGRVADGGFVEHDAFVWFLAKVRSGEAPAEVPLVSIDELAEDPAAYRARWVRVSGRLYRWGRLHYVAEGGDDVTMTEGVIATADERPLSFVLVGPRPEASRFDTVELEGLFFKIYRDRSKPDFTAPFVVARLAAVTARAPAEPALSPLWHVAAVGAVAGLIVVVLVIYRMVVFRDGRGGAGGEVENA